MIRWLWWIVAALHSVMLVCDLSSGTPTFEHEALNVLVDYFGAKEVSSGE